MCAECDQEVEDIRPALGYLLQAESLTRKVFEGNTEAQHTVRLACTIADAYHDTGHDFKTLALSFALTIEKLLALQEVTGLDPS